jgi:DNA-binding NarL/FixJ family response regulator
MLTEWRGRSRYNADWRVAMGIATARNSDRRILRAVELLFSDSNPDTLNRRLIESVDALFPTEITSLNSFYSDGSMRGIDCVSPAGRISKELQATFADLYPQHPLHAAAVNGSGVARDYRVPKRLSDVIPLGRFRDLPLYSEFFRKVGVDRQLIVTVWEGDYATAIALNRRRLDFSDVDLELMGRFQPILQLAVDRTTEVAIYRAKAGRCDGVVTLGLTTGAVDYDTGTSQLLAQHAQASHFGTRDALLKALVEWARSSLSRSNSNGTLPQWTLTSAAGILDVHASLFGGSRRVSLLLREEKLVAAARLTPRETEIMTRLAGTGDSDKELAAAFSSGGRPLSHKTVSLHVGRILQKLGARNRAEAISIWLRSKSSDPEH